MLIANNFCKYFSGIGPNLADKLAFPNQSHQSYLYGNFPNSIFFESASVEEIISIIGSLRTGTSSSYDNICIWSIKNSINLISKTLTHIVNIPLESGIVHDKLKIAKVIPLFKSEERKIISNYRPVSTLPVFSKISEKIFEEMSVDVQNSIWLKFGQKVLDPIGF